MSVASLFRIDVFTPTASDRAGRFHSAYVTPWTHVLAVAN
jgi:hypothetical protein